VDHQIDNNRLQYSANGFLFFSAVIVQERGTKPLKSFS
jgi:hypothetical protein